LGGTAAVLSTPAGRVLAAPTKLAVSIIPIWDVSPFVVADKQGFFTAEDIAVTTEPIHTGSVGIPALIAGSFDVVYSNSIAVFTALERGIDLRIVAEGSPIGMAPPDPGALVMRAGEPIRTGKDLEGKTVGVTARGSIQWLVTRAWIKKTGGDPEKVTYREVRQPQAVDAIKSKQVDAGLVLDPFLTVAMGDPGLARLAWPFETMRGGPTSYWVVTGETADKRTDVVTRFVRAYQKGADWVNANIKSDAYMKIVSSFTKVDPALLGKLVIPPAQRTVDVAPAKALMALMHEHGLLTKELDLSAKVFPASV
jgi:NitT/TauT family transport system substrate-binding protein